MIHEAQRVEPPDFVPYVECDNEACGKRAPIVRIRSHNHTWHTFPDGWLLAIAEDGEQTACSVECAALARIYSW